MHRAAMALAYARERLISSHPAWESVTAAGELRRGCELVRRLSLVAVDPSHSGEPRVLSFAEELTVHVSTRDRFGITLLLATGSEGHLAALRSLAAQKHWILDATGLRDDRRVIASRTEEDIYSSLGLSFIVPELRETGEEVRCSLEGRLPDLVAKSDLRGVLHAHTDQSDGADSLEAMAEAARQRGYAYLGLTDHSQSAHYAGGLKVGEVQAQHRAIDGLNSRYGPGFHVFKGIESDILGDGSLDYSDDILSSFELIIASVHSHFRLDREAQTARVIKAVANPHTLVLGHVTGRLLQKRPGYDVDLERVLSACAQYGVAVEINANPWRLDLDWRWCSRALELGCMVSINPDAHSTQEYENVDWGVSMARKGAVPRERVLNACTCAQFAAHLHSREQRRQRLENGMI
jgi:DNA polymerase (family 10)